MKRFWSRFGPVVLTGLFVVALAIVRLHAQPADETYTTVGPDDIGGERLPATPLVFGAYAAVWVMLLLYVVSLWRRLGRVERDLSEVMTKLGGRQP